MIDVLFAIVMILAIIMMAGAGIMESKKDKAFHSNMKELDKEQLELIEVIEVNLGLRRSR
jgi:hypothetical protein